MKNPGYLVFSPMGYGKTYFINNLPNNLPEENRDLFVDGDEILQKAGIKNKNIYWYPHISRDPKNNNYEDERIAIMECLLEEVSKGKIVLYSGNPYMVIHDFDDINDKSRLIIVYDYDKNKRYEKLKNRNGFCPSLEHFNEEEETYLYCKNNFTLFTSFQDLIPVRIAISGLARAGKDTIGDYLIKHKYERLILAEPLYDILHYAQNKLGFPETKDRQFLQYIGTDWARNKNPDVFINILVEKLDIIGRYVVTDLRFKNEMEILAENNFKFIRVRRQGLLNILEDHNHISENDLSDSDFEIVIDNNGTLEDLYQQIDTILKL